MNKTVLVTGGAGFIGPHTALELQERGYQVIAIDNLSTGHRWAIRADEFIEGDIRDTALLTQVFERNPIDAVVHFAAKSIVFESVINPLDYYDNNVVLVSEKDWEGINETLHLLSIRGMRESITKERQEPLADCPKGLDW